MTGPESGEFHRIIAASVRELVQTYRIQREAGPVTDAMVEQLVSRSAHLVVDTLERITTAGERGRLLPTLVRVMLASFLTALNPDEEPPRARGRAP
jgi:hypothetical protein